MVPGRSVPPRHSLPSLHSYSAPFTSPLFVKQPISSSCASIPKGNPTNHFQHIISTTGKNQQRRSILSNIMPQKKKKPPVAPMPLFSKLPAEIQIMIFHEALRKPQVHFVKVAREQNPGEGNAFWSVTMKPRDKSGDTSGYRLLDNMQDIALLFPVAAEVMRKNMLELHQLPLLKDGSWMMDAATDLVVLEFDSDKSGRMRFWHPRNRVYISSQDVDAIRRQLEGIRKVAFVYGGEHQPDAGSSESVFPCVNHHHYRKHSSWKFCPEELLGLIYQLSHVEAVYFILKHRINAKVVIDYATSYFAVPPATRNSFGLKTFYSTTRSYITVPLPSYTIGPVYHATWKTKDCIWPEDFPPMLVKAARATAMALAPDSREKRYAEHVRKLSHLGRKLDHRDVVTSLVSSMIRQVRVDQDTPVSPDYEWPDPVPPPLVNTARFKAYREQHRRDYNLDNLTRERRENLEFGMLLMVDDAAPGASKGVVKGKKAGGGGGVNKKKKKKEKETTTEGGRSVA